MLDGIMPDTFKYTISKPATTCIYTPLEWVVSSSDGEPE